MVGKEQEEYVYILKRQDEKKLQNKPENQSYTWNTGNRRREANIRTHAKLEINVIIKIQVYVYIYIYNYNTLYLMYNVNKLTITEKTDIQHYMWNNIQITHNKITINLSAREPL